MTDAGTKVAVITGAARGIGLATAHRFIDEGWRIGLLDIDGEALDQSTVNFKNAVAITCDVAVPGQVQTAIEKIISSFGRIDALVNNAGTAVFKPLLETKIEEWQRVLDVNLTGPFLCSQACAPAMIKQGGGCQPHSFISPQRPH